MNELTQEALVRIAHHYYPVGFPPEEDNYDESPLAFQRTPEHQRWRDAWRKALDDWKEWADFLASLQSVFPGHDVWDVTQPWMAACVRCCVYLETSLPDGCRVVTRVVGAVSILAPLYLVYVTTETLRAGETPARPQLTYESTGEARDCADTLAQYIEKMLGYRPFPLMLADVPLPDLRVGHLNLESNRPTLLNALLGESLGNLP
ncbi:hypothetical protein [Vitiosangium sp. GDMCC 1.1324]|uniref:hypothetical protein n=1 Tax=Vitiosangium sp. (strain GDMCC 1.1324) TaxID=2138576 RepID=UPI000D3423D4|nr:hypothetical protein [Vitiosangium sp. GDMCC 1.1324]PTL79614.1 hypothetical protein DAT35_32920 [Vitiosangium sp. GDMCC 1.1324]